MNKSEPGTCSCQRSYPNMESRERCPIHRAALRPSGSDFWNGATCEWQKEPVWRTQQPSVDAEERADKPCYHDDETGKVIHRGGCGECPSEPASVRSSPNIEVELLDEMLKFLAMELSCGPNMHEIRQRIAELKCENQSSSTLSQSATVAPLKEFEKWAKGRFDLKPYPTAGNVLPVYLFLDVETNRAWNIFSQAYELGREARRAAGEPASVRSNGVLCKCCHESKSHDQEPPYNCFVSGCPCDGFTLQKKCEKCGETLPHLYEENCCDYRVGEPVPPTAPTNDRAKLIALSFLLTGNDEAIFSMKAAEAVEQYRQAVLADDGLYLGIASDSTLSRFMRKSYLKRDPSWAMIEPGLYIDPAGYGHVFPDEVVAELSRLFPEVPWDYETDYDLIVKVLREQLGDTAIEFIEHQREEN